MINNKVTFLKKYLTKNSYTSYVLPKKGEPVILLVSGGIDSIVLWDILIKVFKLQVYPLFIDDSDSSDIWKNQRKSATFFNVFYKKKYPILSKELLIVKENNFFRKQIYNAISKNPSKIFEMVDQYKQVGIQNYSTTTLLASRALDYVQLLYLREDITINTIYVANYFSDGEYVNNQTLNSLVTIQLNLKCASQNDKIQFTSLFMENKHQNFFNFKKSDVIKWAKSNNIPLKKTWTCWRRKSFLQCGICTACSIRMISMQQEHLTDRLYQNNLSLAHVKSMTKTTLARAIKHWYSS